MRYYDGAHYVPTKEVEDLFKLNKDELEVSRFHEIIKDKGEYFILTSWKGFEDSDNTYEQLMTMIKDVPAFLEQFLSSYKGKHANRALTMLKEDRKQLEVRNITVNKQGIVSFPRCESTPGNIPAISKGWLPQETRVLVQCIRKYGLGSWIQIRQHLPEKNFPQLTQKVRYLAGKQSLAFLKGIRLDLYRLSTRNRNRYETDYFVNKQPESGRMQSHRFNPGVVKRAFLAWYCSIGWEIPEVINKFCRGATVASRRQLYLELVTGSEVEPVFGTLDDTLAWSKLDW